VRRVASAIAESPLPAALVESMNSCFVVRNHSAQALAYAYFEEEPGPAIGQAAHEG
jgi:hypothetical protein